MGDKIATLIKESALSISASIEQGGGQGKSRITALVNSTLQQYDIILDKLEDKRVEGWPLMDSPFPTILSVVLYIYLSVFLGPKLMENRKPFKITNLVVFYNGFQVIFSAIMFVEHLQGGWLWEYSYRCQPVDYSNNPTAVRMLNLCWWYYISKLTEFVDTLFFVLRKKNNQISLLHVYHHSLTPIITWICIKFLGGGHGTFSNLINNLVHVIMYSYYMISAIGPEYHKYLWWKKYLTTVQMVQFVLVFFHSAQLLYTDCGYPKLIGALLMLHSIIFFFLFTDFYLKTYKLERRRKIENKYQ